MVETVWYMVGVTGLLICLTIGFVSPTVMLLGGLLIVLGWVGDNSQRER